MPFRSYPRHLGKPDGRGYVQCARSGFLRKPHQVRDDERGGQVATDYADYTPGFGTAHPQDRKQLDLGGDPSPVENARPPDRPLSKQDLRISDAEILLAIQENRPPRPGTAEEVPEAPEPPEDTPCDRD